MISHFRTYDTHETIVIFHKPGPEFDPMKYAREQLVLRLEARGMTTDDEDKYAVYEHGDWILEDKFV